MIPTEAQLQLYEEKIVARIPNSTSRELLSTLIAAVRELQAEILETRSMEDKLTTRILDLEALLKHFVDYQEGDRMLRMVTFMAEIKRALEEK